jgi:ribonuclease HIII
VIILEKQKTIVYKLSDNTKEEMIEHFKDKLRDKTPPYAIFQADEADTVVTLYESGKVVFQGVSADIDAEMWKEKEAFLNGGKKVLDLTKKKDDKKEKAKDNKDYYFINSIGSDEVGTGDYFGPVVVTSTYVNKKDISFLEDLGVRDSKKITDDKIIKITPEIIKRIPHTTIILNNKDYNANYSEDVNMNKIKAILHNKVLYNLLNKDKYSYDMIVVDQFVNQYKYYDYLKGIPNVVRNITFTTKAEDKCLSVACASIISRYIFLKEMKSLGDKLGIYIPKGASTEVDKVAKTIVDKYGVNKLKEIAKYNFKNTSKVIEK